MNSNFNHIPNQKRGLNINRAKMNPISLKKPVLKSRAENKNEYSYDVLFSNICKLRFNQLVTKSLTTVTTTVLVIFWLLQKFKISNFLLLLDEAQINNPVNNSFLSIPINWVLTYLSFIIIYVTKKNYLHVSFDVKKNKWKRIIKKTISYFFLYCISYLLLSLGISQLSVFTHPEGFSKYFKMVSIIFVSCFYTAQHVYLDLDRLVFINGERQQMPQKYITSRLRNSVQKSVVLSVMNSVTIIILHFALLSPVFKMFTSQKQIYNKNMPNNVYGGRIHAQRQNYYSTTYSLPGFVKFFQYTIVNMIVFQLWDLCNITFNAYLSIGPMYKGNLISALSPSPMETLISGLRSKNSFSKLTAFQELSYRSRMPLNYNGLMKKNADTLRTPIYENSQYWSMILQECFKVINQTNEKISNYTMKFTYANNQEYLERINILRQQQEQRDFLKAQEHDAIFGTKESDNMYSFYTEASNQKDQWGSNVPIPTMSNNFDNIFLNGPPSEEDKKFYYDDGQDTKNLVAKYIVPYVASKFDRFMKLILFPDTATSSFTSSSQHGTISSFFYNTNAKRQANPQRQAEKLCPLPPVYAEAVLSVMGILINSLDEDPKSACIGSISEVLKMLTNSISCLDAFVNCQQKTKASGKLSAEEDQTTGKSITTISLLYDLCTQAFLELVMKYNELLNNIVLEDDVRNLIKYVSDQLNN